MKNDYALSKKTLNATGTFFLVALLFMAFAFTNQAAGQTYKVKAGEEINLTVPGTEANQEYRVQRTFPYDPSYLMVTAKGGDLEIPPFSINTPGNHIITVFGTGKNNFAHAFTVKVNGKQAEDMAGEFEKLFPNYDGSRAGETISYVPSIDVYGVVTICADGSVVVTIANSVNGATYSLQQTNIANPLVLTKTGDGGTISFDPYLVTNAALGNEIMLLNVGGGYLAAFSVAHVSDPTAPTLNMAPASPVCQGTTIDPTLNTSGSGGISCSDRYEFSTDGGTSWAAYTLGTGIPTSGLTFSGGQATVKVKAIRDNTSCTTCGCYHENVYTWTVNENPVPTITPGSTDVCANDVVTYTTESGADANTYTWNVSSEGTIQSGGGSNDNTVTVKWDNTTGTGQVSVNYEVNGCDAASATVFNQTIDGVAQIVGGNIYCTLQDAIDNAASGQTVKLLKSVSEGMVTINKDITLDGDGFILTSTSATYGLKVASANVKIKDITVDDSETYGIQVQPESDFLTIENTTVQNCGTAGSGSPYATGYGINCSDNVTLTNIKSFNNEGNGLSLDDCNVVTITGYESSGNSFGAFGAGIEISASGDWCTVGTSNITIGGTVSIGESPAIYETGSDNISAVTLPGTFTHFTGFYNTNKFYFTSLVAALNFADAALAGNPASQPVVYVKEVGGTNLYVAPKNTATVDMSINAAIIAAASSDAINVYSGTYDENVVVNKGVVLKGANADVACDSRLAESIIAPTSGLPFNVTADGVTINGFEITAPNNVYAINMSNTSNTSVLFNNIHHVGSSLSGGYVHSVVYQVANAPAATSNVSINDNCFDNIGSSSLSGASASAIGILHSGSTGVLTNLYIERNTIDNVVVNTGTWPTGKIAYGIQLNTGSANYTTTTGKIVNAQVKDNNISDLTGFISTGIALEGNTEDAIVTGNTVANLTGYKLDNRAVAVMTSRH